MTARDRLFVKSRRAFILAALASLISPKIQAGMSRAAGYKASATRVAAPVYLQPNQSELRLSSDQLKLPLPYSGIEKPGRSDRLDSVEAEYSDFLKRLGFKDYPSEIARNLADPQTRLTRPQRQVLLFNAKRYEAINAARDLAAAVMSGLSRQNYSPEALERAAELAAKLLALQPLSPPSALPPEIAEKNKKAVLKWWNQVRVQQLHAQLLPVVSDIAKVQINPRISKNKKIPPETTAHVKQISDRAGRVLITAYFDDEIGQTRYAGRALAASLVRHARLNHQNGLEASLRKKVRARGLYLDNFIGDTLIVHDAADPSKPVFIPVKTGDFLGERSSGREAAEIVSTVRPTGPTWRSAFSRKLLGPMLLGFWANPLESPKMGSRFYGLRMALWRFRKKWLAKTPLLRRGFSHVGTAVVDSADGVSMSWAMDIYPNAEKGGIRRIGILDQFALPGIFLRLGVARFDAGKVWEAFVHQFHNEGYGRRAYRFKSGSWPTAISRAEYEALGRIQKTRAQDLLDAINLRAVAALEAMLTQYGAGFAPSYHDISWRPYCASAQVIARLMGALFESQSFRDHWRSSLLAMKEWEIGPAKNQNFSGRIMWPGSLFADPKIGFYRQVTYPPFQGIGKNPDPAVMPAYLEMDPALTRLLRPFVGLSLERAEQAENDAFAASMRAHLDTRDRKTGFASGDSRGIGHASGLEQVLREADND